jgi:hypothetical protein
VVELNTSMDYSERHSDEGLTSYAIFRRDLPQGHPGRITRQQFDELMKESIANLERRSAAIHAALAHAGKLHSRI